MNTRKKGAEKEKLAAEYLEQQGMRIVERNFRSKRGEIDLIGYDGGFLVFVEVKYRADSGKGTALEAVTPHKQRQICRVADFYRFTHGMGENTAVRYDVIAVQGEEVLWLRNAFPHVYTGNCF